MNITVSEYRKYSRIFRRVSAVALVIALISLYLVLQSGGLLRDIVSQSSDGRPYVVPFDRDKIDTDTISFWALIVSFAAFVVSAAGFISTGILGWRKDGREKREAELVRQKLELEIENLKRAGEGQEGGAPSEQG